MMKTLIVTALVALFSLYAVQAGNGGNGSKGKCPDAADKATLTGPCEGNRTTELPWLRGCWCKDANEDEICKKSKQRWFYDEDKNKCTKYLYRGCGFNVPVLDKVGDADFAGYNSYDSNKACKTACKPPVSD